MSSILISHGSFVNATSIARRVAQLLDYRLVTDEVFEATASRFSISTDKLHEACERGPSLLGMSDSIRKRLFAFLQASLAAALLEDGRVYQGPFAHALVPGVSHIMRVGLVASPAYRAQQAIEALNLTPRAAQRRVSSDDANARDISQIIFRRDVSEDNLDLVVEAEQTDVAAAAIAEAIRDSCYAPMTFSKNVMREVELAHRVRSILMDIDTDTAVEVFGGSVTVRAHAPTSRRGKTTSAIDKRLTGLEGIESVHVHVFDTDLMAAGRR